MPMPHAASSLSASPAVWTGKLPCADEATPFAAVRAALSAYQANPNAPENDRELRAALSAVSRLVAKIPRRASPDALVSSAQDLIKEVSRSGAHDYTVSPAELAHVQELCARGWPGLLAAMLLVPAWQWSAAPALGEAPDWLWSDYTSWLFAAPQMFPDRGQADLYAAHILFRLEELNRWVERNVGSPVVRRALEAYLKTASGTPLYLSNQSLRTHAELRGRLLTRGFTKPADSFDPLPEPRGARKLRVGFVNRDFGFQPETFTTLPTFEQLDPTRFEVVLFAHQNTSDSMEAHCRSRAAESYTFPPGITDQLSMLRAAALDIVVFGTNVTGEGNEVALLALHRVAPLQVVNNSTCITSGLPEVDLYVSGTLTEIPDAEAHYSERLGLLPGPAHAFSFQTNIQAPDASWTRTALSIPENATVFITAASYSTITPEMQHVWAKLLAAVPGTLLLVHPSDSNSVSAYQTQRFCADFDRVLKIYGVDGSRFIVSTAHLASRCELKELLLMGDIYLDTYPFGGVNSLVSALELGIPTIAWEGNTFRSRTGGALLRSLSLAESVATDEVSYLALGHKLGSDKAQRTEVSDRMLSAMARQPIFLDALAASDAYGDLLEVAFDELVNVGRQFFRADRTPLLSANFEPAIFLREGSLGAARHALRISPSDTAARHKVGKALIELGENARAVDYLLAAVQTDENNPLLWYDLAVALRLSGQNKEAVQALESSLRMDPRHLEGWLMLAELATAAGSHDLAREAAGLASAISPQDPRIATFLNG